MIKLSDNRNLYRGIGWMLASAFAFAITATVSKSLTIGLVLPWLVFLRFAAPTLIISWAYLITTSRRPHIHSWHWHLLRAVFGVLSQYCFFAYLLHGHIFDATVLFCTGPVFLPLLSRLCLKTPIKFKVWLSVIISFIGVICITKPSDGVFQWFALIGLGGGLFNAASQLVFHRIAKTHDGLTAITTMYWLSSLLALILLACFGFPHWQRVDTLFSHSDIALLLIGMGIASVSSQLLRNRAYRCVNKAASLGPFFYAVLIFAGLLQWLFYQQAPGSLSIIGAALIAAGGIVMIFKKGEKHD